MAKLPNAHLAFVEPAKLAAYLLDPNHEDGGPKSKLLQAIGFDIARPMKLRLPFWRTAPPTRRRR